MGHTDNMILQPGAAAPVQPRKAAGALKEKFDAPVNKGEANAVFKLNEETGRAHAKPSIKIDSERSGDLSVSKKEGGAEAQPAGIVSEQATSPDRESSTVPDKSLGEDAAAVPIPAQTRDAKSLSGVRESATPATAEKVSTAEVEGLPAGTLRQLLTRFMGGQGNAPETPSRAVPTTSIPLNTPGALPTVQGAQGISAADVASLTPRAGMQPVTRAASPVASTVKTSPVASHIQASALTPLTQATQQATQAGEARVSPLLVESQSGSGIGSTMSAIAAPQLARGNEKAGVPLPAMPMHDKGQGFRALTAQTVLKPSLTGPSQGGTVDVAHTLKGTSANSQADSPASQTQGVSVKPSEKPQLLPTGTNTREAAEAPVQAGQGRTSPTPVRGAGASLAAAEAMHAPSGKQFNPVVANGDGTSAGGAKSVESQLKASGKNEAYSVAAEVSMNPARKPSTAAATALQPSAYVENKASQASDAARGLGGHPAGGEKLTAPAAGTAVRLDVSLKEPSDPITEAVDSKQQEVGLRKRGTGSATPAAPMVKTSLSAAAQRGEGGHQPSAEHTGYSGRDSEGGRQHRQGRQQGQEDAGRLAQQEILAQKSRSVGAAQATRAVTVGGSLGDSSGSGVAEALPAVMAQIDRLRRSGRETVAVDLPLSGGKRLKVSLTLKGADRVEVAFETDSPTVKEELERGWKHIVAGARERGVQLQRVTQDADQSLANGFA